MDFTQQTSTVNLNKVKYMMMDRLSEIITNSNAIIFGGFVRDRMIHDHFAVKFMENEGNDQEKFDDALTEEATRIILDETNWDDREKSIRMAGEWMLLCPELAPAVVLFYAPPYYPAVNSSADPRSQEVIAAMKKIGEAEDFTVQHIHYFNGICDLSYVNYDKSTTELDAYGKNTPVWGHTYSVPFEAMSLLKAPVLNIGPFGKDPHQRTERLHRENAFVHTPKMLHELMRVWVGNEKNSLE